MDVRFTKSGNTAILNVSGRLDTLTAPDFESGVCGWIEQGEDHIVLDFADLEYISSAGLRSVLVAAKQLRQKGGRLSCCSMSGVVRKVFDVSGFSKMVEIHDSVDDAVSAG